MFFVDVIAIRITTNLILKVYVKITTSITRSSARERLDRNTQKVLRGIYFKYF